MAKRNWVARNFWLLTAGLLAVCMAATAMAEDLHFQRMSGCPYTVGSQPYCTIADVNGDGKGDVVTGNRKDNTITIMLANDSGGLTEASNSPLDPGVTLTSMYAGPMRIAPSFGDIDGDGDQDMVLDCAEGVALMLNDGSGGFAHANGSPFSTGMQELADKWADNWYVSIWIPDPTKYGHPSYSTVMDMNGDNLADVVARTGGDTYITILLGQSDGTLKVADGYPLDLVRANVKDSNGDPAYPPELDAVAITGGWVPRAHNVGDFNGDGVPDYMVPRGIMVGTGGGKFTEGPVFAYPGVSSPSTSPNYLAVLDMNGDNHDDFLWGATDGQSNTEGGPPHVMFRSDGAGGYSWEYGDPSKGLPVIADVNGDGNDDLVGIWGIFSGYPYGLYVHYGDGQGNFTQAPWAPLNVWSWTDFYYQSKSITVGDVNGDGKPDIAVSFGSIDNWNPSGTYDKKLDVFINTKTGDFKPVLQRPFLAGGRLNQSFEYRIAAVGTKPITFSADPLPAGLTLNGDTISGTPTKEGQTKVTLTATNGAGSDSAVLTITISDGTNQAPEITAGPGAAPNPAIMNQPVIFSVTATDPDNDTLSYAWSFGDGGTGSGASPAHTYTAPGTYQAVVTVTDGVGGSAWGGVSVVVQEFGGQGDLNGDKVVNVDDVTLVIRHHGETSDNPNWDARADANGDGKVDNADLQIVIENFGRIYG